METTFRPARMLAVAAAVLLAAITGCGGGPAPGTDDGERTLRLGFAGAVLAPGAAMYTSIPEKLGFWAEEGLSVEIVRVEGTAVALSAMVGGQIDLAVVSGEAVVPAIADGNPFVIPYSVSQRGIVTTVVPAASPVRGLADLAGATIGVPNLASGAVAFTKAGLAEAGVDPASVTFVAVGTGAQPVAALTSGQVDAVSDTDTSAVSFQQSGAELRVLESDVADQLVIGIAATTTRDYLAENGPVVEAWARGVAKATEWMRAHPGDAVRLHYDAFPDTRPSGDEAAALATGTELAQARLRNVTPADGADYGAVRPEQLEAVIGYLREFGGLTAPVDPAAVFDGSLIAGINDFDRAAVAATPVPRA